MRLFAIAIVLLSVSVPFPLAHAQEITAELVASGFIRPIYVVSPPGDNARLMVVEQAGVIRIIKDGSVLAQPFLDIQTKVVCCSERGLLGLAFHPDYDSNGIFFVHYSGLSGETVIERYLVSANPDVADVLSAEVFLTASQPFTNHNGGMIAFRPGDPNNYLYVALGDGGSGGDPGNRAQDLTTVLGKVLRLDVDQGVPATAPPSNPFVGVAGDDLIWVYGLRNPWRFSFDRLTGDMYIGDVGQNSVEEIDFQPASSAGGENYGWRLLEGSSDFNCTDCDGARALTILPIHEYIHTGAASVTGGYVYRGSRILSRRGHYFFGDFVNGRLWSFNFDGIGISDFQDWTGLILPANTQLASFGENAAGDLFVVDLQGLIYKLVSADPFNSDIDDDGLTDGDEDLLGTDIENSDTDGDGLTDGEEVNTHGTNPLLADSDGDGVPDGVEIARGTNPLTIPHAPIYLWLVFAGVLTVFVLTIRFRQG